MASDVQVVTPAQLGIREGEAYDRQLDFDVGALTVVQPNAIDDPGVLAGSSEAIKDVATKITQSLFNKLFALPTTAIPGGLLARLPHPTEPLPRAKPVPKPKPLTKWEQFAKEKGIVKKKKSKLEFDEVSQEWKRRHGYNKANDPLAAPIIDAEDGDQGGEDPFTRMEREKRERVESKSSRKAGNAGGGADAGAVPATVKLTTKLDAASARGQLAKGRALKPQLQQASYLAGVSTASMGKFDKRLKGERASERRLPGMRKKLLPVAGGGEGESVAKVLGSVVRGSEGDLVNVDRAIGNLKAAKAKERHAEGGEDGQGGRKKKGRVGRVKNRRVPKKSKAPAGKAAGKGGKGGKGGGVKGGGVGKKGKKPQKG
eukprot:jgi/Ulvmu1/8850/UM049_0032.1